MFKVGDCVLIATAKGPMQFDTIVSGVVDSVKECEWEDEDVPEYTIGVAVEDDGIYYRFAHDVRYDVDPMLIDELLEL